MLIRNMDASDIDFCYHCTSSEGWLGETRSVFGEFLAHDPGGCFIAEQGSEKIGLCISTKYDIHGFLGELIVIKSMRGRGFGRRLFDHAVRYLQSHQIKNILLDGDLGAVHIYQASGFRKVCESLRFTGTLDGKKHPSVRKMTAEDMDEVCSLDRAAFGDDRSFFLKRRFERFSNLCFVLVLNDRVAGYVMAMPGVDVVAVGPMLAPASFDNPHVLLERLAIEVPGKILRIGILDSNPEAVTMMKSLSTFEEQVPSWRMVLGDSERLGMHRDLLAIGTASKG